MPTSFTTTSENRPFGGDQARGLRALAAHRAEPAKFDSTAVNKCHTIVVSGGKGGVGRSVIALNLAVTLSQRGSNVGLLDASPDLGNIDLLCGLNGYWSLPHVIQGSRQLGDVLLKGPAGVTILTGAASLPCINSDCSPNRSKMFDQLTSMERELDWLIVDASGSACELTREFAFAADDVLIVATPEPTAVAEAYASVKSLSSNRRSRLGLLVNQADSELQAQRILDRLQQAAHSFLRVDLHRRGYIPRDVAIPMSVNGRVPFVIQSPESAATHALNRLCQRWIRPGLPEGTSGFFCRLHGIQLRRTQN